MSWICMTTECSHAIEVLRRKHNNVLPKTLSCSPGQIGSIFKREMNKHLLHCFSLNRYEIGNIAGEGNISEWQRVIGRFLTVAWLVWRHPCISEQEILKLKQEEKTCCCSLGQESIQSTTLMDCTDKRQASNISRAPQQAFVGIVDIIKLFLSILNYWNAWILIRT